MAQLNNLPKQRRQSLNCSMKKLFALPACATAFRAFSTILGPPTIPNSELIVHSVGRDLKVTALLPQKHQCGIDRDPCEPGRETGPLLEAVQVNEGFHERFLKDILCILPVLYDAISPAQNHLGVARAEFNKGNSVPRLRSRD